MSRGMWHRTLVYLGLKEEPEFDQEEFPERPRRDQLPDEQVDEPAPPGRPTLLIDDGLDDDPGDGPTNVRALHGDALRAVGGPALVRAAVVEVYEFDDAEAIGSRYRTGQPVVFDVSGAPAGVARRIVDFVAGLTYASHGRLDKVADRAFLLLPDGVELSPEERRRLDGLGYRTPARSES